MKSLVTATLLIFAISCSSSHSDPQTPNPLAQLPGATPSTDPVAGGASLGTGASNGSSTDNPAPATTDDGKSEAISVNFVAKVGDEALKCADFSADSQAKGQIFTNVRMFISNLALVNADGKTVKLVLDVEAGSENLQYIDADSNSVALLNFIDATCAKGSATSLVKTSITGQLPHGAYQSLQFQLGLPYPAMDERLPAVPAALAPSDMGWMWQHYPADFQIAVQANATDKPKLLNALTSDTKVVTTLPLAFISAADGAKALTIQIDLSKLFVKDAATFVSGLETACDNSTAALTEASPNCAFAYKALGATVKNPKEAYQQTVFSLPAL